MPQQVVLVTTGSQGEPMSALSRMAYSDHRKVMVGEGDFIIISANPIPGNEKTVGNVVDELLKKGCKVIYESMYEVHVSGHACQEELKIMQKLVKPKYFIPVHGEQKHLRKHADLAMFLGMERKNIYIGDVGSVLEINEDYMKELPPVQAGKVFVDGLGVGDVGSIVLRDRKHLGQDGLIIIVASLDVYDGHVISGPDIVSRGFVYVRESERLLEEVKQTALAILEDCAENNVHEWGIIKNRIMRNGYAAYANFEYYFWELAAYLTQNASLKVRRTQAVLSDPYPKVNKLRRFVRAYAEEGRVTLPTAVHASSVLSNMRDCNCFIDMEPGRELHPGDEVKIQYFK